LIAHRGFAGIYPENTLAAMEGSSKEGADMIEIDVQPCADDTVVVFHDLRLDGKTDEEGIVTETDCETVLSAEVLDSGETIPTLEEAMDVIPASVAVNIELKYSGRADEDTEASELSNRWLPLVERTREIASEQDNAILISSFFDNALAATRDVDSSVPLAYLIADSAERGLLVAEQYGCGAVHPSKAITDEDLVRQAHDASRGVNPYTIDTEAEADRLQELGVDGDIANYPDVLG
jgi:glycerophosphoryl diester phosphodiesterase